MRSADADLVARCRDGDVGAFEELYRRHSGRVYNLAYRMSGTVADAEDLLQEIFLLAHRKLASFKGNSSLGTWLYRLAMNHCLDHLRSRQTRMAGVTESIEDGAAAFGTASRPSALTEKPMMLPEKLDMERAITELPEGCRAAFLLHDVEGFEHHEVGEILGIAAGTSKSQVHKARLRLREFLTAKREQ